MIAVKNEKEYRELGYFDEPEKDEVLITTEEFLARQREDGSLDLELKYP